MVDMPNQLAPIRSLEVLRTKYISLFGGAAGIWTPDHGGPKHMPGIT